MQRDVKVGLVLGVLLVAVVAVVFFRRDDDNREDLTKLLPAPDAMKDRARDLLGPSASDPYPVPPESLVDSWGTTRSKSARTPTPPRNKNGEETDVAAASSDSRGRGNGSAAAVLEAPEFDPPRPGTRSRLDSIGNRLRTATADTKSSSGATEYTIRDGDTLSEIARQYLGSASLYNVLYDENRDVLNDPGNIPVGQKIRIPTAPKQDRTNADRSTASLAASHGNSTIMPPRTTRTASRSDSVKGVADDRSYVVREGDSLIRIAREKYGRDSMYLEILHANQDQIENPGQLQPGMVLRLPQLP